jgi:3-hydroxy-9,10-secoandrosta-1,3,5(10)-triene-9,17-dione monooxygenase
MIRLQVADTTWRPPEEDYDKDYTYYHVPFFPAYFMGSPSIALGGTERILHEFKNYSARRLRVLEGIMEGDNPRAQRALAEMTAEFHAAEALMNQYIDLLEGHRTGNVIGRGQFFAIRTKIIKSCVDIAVRALQAMGAEALYKGGIVEQHLRDILSLATHKTSLYEDALSAYGVELFGRPSGAMG